MPIQTNSQYSEEGGIRVETMTSNGPVDNDDYVAAKAHHEHNLVSNEPWSQSYKPNREVCWDDTEEVIVLDPEVSEAIRRDIRKRNLNLKIKP